MFFSKKDKANKLHDVELDEDIDLEDELDEEEEVPAPAPKPQMTEEAPEADGNAAAEDDDEYDDDDLEDSNDADDEEERYLLSLARRQKLKKYIAVIIAAVVVVVAATLLIVRAVTHVDPNKTALKVGDSEVKLSEFAFNYFYSVDYFGQQYKDTLQQYGADLSGDLRSQPCLLDNTITWHDYFVKQASDLLQQNVSLYERAIAEGYSVTDEDTAMVEQYFQNMDDFMAQTGSSLERVYGNAVDEASLTFSLLRMSIANRYRNDVIKTLPITDEDIEAYFQENKATLQTASYRMMIFSDANMDEGSELTAEQAANEMAGRITDEASFIELAKEYAPEASKQNYENDNYTLAEGIYAQQFQEAVASDWLFSADRKAGDVTVLDIQQGYAVTYFIGLGRDESRTINVRHILIQPSQKTDEGKQEAKAEAERIYQEWKDGAADEALFSELAKQYSGDGNASQGGIYENVKPGQMVQTYNDWCFDPAREYGDNGIVETEYGFHIMFFCGWNEPNWKASIRTNLQSKAYSDYATAMLEENPCFVYDNVVKVLTR